MTTRILVIDDEEDYRVIAEEILKSAGWEVKTAQDGEKALAALKDFAPDVILVDWNMPVMDGEDFCRALRADPRFKGVPAIMLTVKGDVESELEALHFGADDFLAKPFEPKELISHVKAALRRARPAAST
ncbi:MAG: response regulator [Elusimicrobia bacterium]|nr:response regulator [Elusimicrobiota bacterium]